MLLASRLNKLMGNNERQTIMLLMILGSISLLGLILTGSRSLALGLLFLAGASAFMYGANSLLLGVIPMNFAKIGAVSTVAGFLDFSSYLAAGAASVITGLTVQYLGWNAMLLFWCLAACIGAGAFMLERILSGRRSEREDSI